MSGMWLSSAAWQRARVIREKVQFSARCRTSQVFPILVGLGGKRLWMQKRVGTKGSDHDDCFFRKKPAPLGYGNAV